MISDCKRIFRFLLTGSIGDLLIRLLPPLVSIVALIVVRKFSSFDVSGAYYGALIDSSLLASIVSLGVQTRAMRGELRMGLRGVLLYAVAASMVAAIFVLVGKSVEIFFYGFFLFLTAFYGAVFYVKSQYHYYLLTLLPGKLAVICSAIFGLSSRLVFIELLTNVLISIFLSRQFAILINTIPLRSQVEQRSSYIKIKENILGASAEILSNSLIPYIFFFAGYFVNLADPKFTFLYLSSRFSQPLFLLSQSRSQQCQRSLIFGTSDEHARMTNLVLRGGAIAYALVVFFIELYLKVETRELIAQSVFLMGAYFHLHYADVGAHFYIKANYSAIILNCLIALLLSSLFIISIDDKGLSVQIAYLVLPIVFFKIAGKVIEWKIKNYR